MTVIERLRKYAPLGLGVVAVVGLILFLHYRTVKITNSDNNVPTLPNTRSVDFITTLPYSTDDYKIELVANTGTTTLLIIPNITINGLSSPADQINAQWDTYFKDSREAIEYIKAKAGSIADYNITFWFQEFWPAGKTIDPATL